MTPTEMDLLHLRLVRIGDVLDALVQAEDWKLSAVSDGERVFALDLVRDIRKGLNR